jgi:RNA recognition motif-containing protein
MSKRLFVGNLSYNTTENDLQAAFAPYGATSVTIPTDYDGRGKGFAFIDVADDQLNAAISAMNGKDISGRSVNVNEARPRPERSSGGGGGGFGGGGGGGSRSGGGGGGSRGGGNRW